MAGDAPALQLPDGWTKLKVSQLIGNGWLEIGDGYRAKNSEMADAGLPFVRAGDVNGRVNTTGVDLLGEASLAAVGNKRSRPGDAVITTKGTIGRMALVRPDDPAFIYSPQLCFWRSLNPRKIDPNWLYYALHSEEMRHQMSWSAAQTDMAPYISLTDQRTVFEITLPPIDDQISIGGVLLSLDMKIDLNRQMAATLEEMARSLFKSWFVDFDPVHAKADGRDTGLPADIAALFPDRFGDDALPLGWQYRNMLELAHWVNGAAYKNMHFVDSHGGLPVVKIAELKSGLTKQTKFTNTDLGCRYKIFDGELLFSWSGSPETSIDSFIWMNGEAWLNQHIFAVRENGECPKALHHAMLKYFKPRFVSIARDKQTTGLGHVTKDDMKNLLLGFPPKDTLFILTQQFDKIFDRYINVLAQQSILEELMTTLLPKLLSGELRVDDAADSIAAA